MEEVKAFKIRFRLTDTPKVPVQDVRTRWNSRDFFAYFVIINLFFTKGTFYQLQSCVPIRSVIDLLLQRFQTEYDLELLSSRDWIIITQLCGLLGPFEPLSKYLEGEKFVTVTDYLARFAFVHLLQSKFFTTA